MSGSKWHIWDLHFHSQSSFDYKNKSTTNQEMIDGIIANGISVVAITDHHLIDIDRIKDLQSISAGRVTILPGIEFRSNLGGSESIHFIGIFSENADLDHIWINLQSKCELTTSDISSKGGHEKIYVDLFSTANLIHELGGIVTVHAGGKSNSLESIRNNHEYKKKIKTDLTRQCIDVFECGAESDISDYEEIVFPFIKMRRPLILCSDNHDIKNYSTKQNLWIKAEPTFQGLKQIQYEPLDRVKIQFDEPEQKKPYYVIKEVRYIDNSGHQDFDKSYIPLNPNLNTIIGGKSTGKSLLLYHIAKSIDADLVNKLISEGVIKKYDYEDETDFDFEVVWESGDSNFLNDDRNKRKIIYIPQAYLSKLSDSNLANRKSLNNFIKNLLLEDEVLLEKYQNRTKNIHEITNDIQKDCRSLSQVKSERKSALKKLKELGNSKGVQQHIENLQKEISTLKKASGLSEKELKKYDDLVENGKALRIDQSNLKADLENIEEFERKMLNHIESIETTYEEHNNRFEINKIKEAFEKETEFIRNLKGQLEKAKEDLTNNSSEYKKQNNQNILALNKTIKEIKPLLSKVKLKDQISKKEEEIRKEAFKLHTIKKIVKEIDEKDKAILTYTNRICKGYEELMKTYKTLTSELSISLSDPSLSISVNYHFDIDMFNESLSTCVFKHSLKSNYASYNSDNSNKDFIYDYKRSNHREFINELVKDIVGNKTQLFKNTDQTTALIQLLKDHFFIDFGLTYKSDVLNKMSPGKKNLALLKILIELSKEEWPILIDQPEDELDNRSIYKELVEFLRTKKKQRQFIMITHNPNVVVSADSENVIVANQDGQEPGADNETYKFEYKTGSIENELYNPSSSAILTTMTIKEHVCEVLEGGEEAFRKRERKYDFSPI